MLKVEALTAENKRLLILILLRPSRYVLAGGDRHPDTPLSGNAVTFVDLLSGEVFKNSIAVMLSRFNTVGCGETPKYVSNYWVLANTTFRCIHVS